ncbi:hypothetical protein B1B_01255, partial [mine drainage metagenome]
MSLSDRMTGRWGELYSDLLPELLPAMEAPPQHHPCPHPGHLSRHGDAFRLFRDWNESGGGVCNTCGARPNGVLMLEWLLGLDRDTVVAIIRDWVDRVEPVTARMRWRTPAIEQAPQENDLKLASWLSQLWSQAARMGDPGAEIARSYLRYRGIPDWLIMRTGNLRGVPSLSTGRGSQEAYPALLGRYQGSDGHPIAVHRIWCTAEGKAPISVPKKTTPHRSDHAMRGGAIRLFEPYRGTLGVAEGIETALGASLVSNMPVWSCLSCGLLSYFVPPEGVHHLHVWGDADRAG